MSDDLHAELDRIFAARDRNDMGPTIAAFQRVHERNPEDARVLYELAGAHDTAGNESTAVELYERALAGGISGDLRRRCLLQYGSTLRNLERYDESLSVFRTARREFPESIALVVFEALSLHASGRVNASLASVLELVAGRVDDVEVVRYGAAITGNASYLRSLDRPTEDTPT